MSDPFKVGETRTLRWDLDPEPPAGATVDVIIGVFGQTPVVSRTAELDGARISITVDHEDPFVAFTTYSVESKCTATDGSVTRYPHDGFDTLYVGPALG